MGRRELFQEGEEARNVDYSAHNVVHIGCIDNHVSPVETVFFRKVRSNGRVYMSSRLTWLRLQLHIPRIAKGHFPHDIEGHVVELLNDVHAHLPIFHFNIGNYVQKLIDSADQNIFVLHQVGNAKLSIRLILECCSLSVSLMIFMELSTSGVKNRGSFSIEGSVFMPKP
jgi:hypothetical protein